MGYRVCETCGAHLDAGEKCDCKKEESPENKSGLPPIRNYNLNNQKKKACRIDDITFHGFCQDMIDLCRKAAEDE